jgi:hypothetical protein
MSINVFWWRWLIVVSVGVILFSLGFIFLPDSIHSLYSIILNQDMVFAEEAMHYLRLVYGVLGSVMLGWMIVVLFILLGAFRRGERGAWNAITLSIVIWFVLDSGYSVYTGFVGNAIFNAAFLVLFAIPLAATYRHFQR